MSHSRGLQIDVIAPRSKFYEGPFGRICPELKPWGPVGVPDHKIADHFQEFANKHMVDVQSAEPHDIDERDPSIQALNSKIPAGYTYFGQFIDHDITFDPTPLGARMLDPNGLKNFRTPRLDLDCVYGSGPADQPYLYNKDDPENAKRFVIGNVGGSGLRDLQRNGDGRAIIGDMRNDENSIVCQIQLAFLLAHNALVERATAHGHAHPFEAARNTLRWLYQWIVWNDFIPRVTVDEVQKAALSLDPTPDGRHVWKLGLKDIYNWKHHPYMPIEFAAGAYRFGHSMVRNGYQTNFQFNNLDFTPIFNNTTPGQETDDLRGFRPLTADNTVQWDWFLDMVTSQGPDFPQRARKIDTKLANALLFLPENDGDPADLVNKLAARNLLRGWMMGLPSGLDMADKLCLKKINLSDEEPESLWYYILREAQAGGGQQLGRLGSIIVCATFAGWLKGDPCSWFNLRPCWTPDDDPLLCNGVDNEDDDRWGLQSIIRIAGLPINIQDVGSQDGGSYPDTIACAVN